MPGSPVLRFLGRVYALKYIIWIARIIQALPYSTNFHVWVYSVFEFFQQYTLLGLVEKFYTVTRGCEYLDYCKQA